MRPRDQGRTRPSRTVSASSESSVVPFVFSPRRSVLRYTPFPSWREMDLKTSHSHRDMSRMPHFLTDRPDSALLGRLLRHKARQQWFPVYLRGQLSASCRRCATTMARETVPEDEEQLHHLVSTSPGDGAPLEAEWVRALNAPPRPALPEVRSRSKRAFYEKTRCPFCAKPIRLNRRI